MCELFCIIFQGYFEIKYLFIMLCRYLVPIMNYFVKNKIVIEMKLIL